MISVVIPVKNRAELVKRTLQSLAEQTLAPDAVYLVDNGSTDGTVHTLRQWAEGRTNVTVLTEPEAGAAFARNRGLEYVVTPYVMFFDSDDIMPPHHIEEVTFALNAAERPDIGVFDMELYRLDGVVEQKPYRRGDIMAMHIFHALLATQRCVIRTELARRAGGWNQLLPAWNDLEFGVRLLAEQPQVEYLALSEPVRVVSQRDSITGMDFSSRAGQWERALDACAVVLRGSRYARLIDYRRAILAGMYRREGHAELAAGMARSFGMKLIERYVAAGGRGVAYIAGIFG